MKKQKFLWVVIGIALLLMIAGLFFWYITRPVTIKSDDNLLSLTIPYGALPDDTDKNNIKVSLMNTPNDTEDLVSAYKLQPEGLKFSKPVHVVFNYTKPDPGKALVAYHVDYANKGIEMIKNSSYTENEDGTGTMEGDITHFSDLYVSNDFFMLYVSGGGEHYIDPKNSFAVKVDLHTFTNTRWYKIIESQEVKIVLQKPWWVSGEFNADSDILQPVLYKDAPPKTQINLDKYETSRDFVCKKEGFTHVTYTAHIEANRIKSFYGNTVIGVITSLFESDKEVNDTNDLRMSVLVHCQRYPHEMIVEAAQKMAKWNSDVDEKIKEEQQKLLTPKFEVKEEDQTSQNSEPKSTTYNGKTYYIVNSEDPNGNSGDKVCQSVGKKCVGYTALTTDVCKSFHPDAEVKSDWNGAKPGFYCNGAPQGGICAEEKNTCHICPMCNMNMDCSGTIGDLYRETYVECK